MKIQFSSGLKFVSFVITNEDVTFYPEDRWEFVGYDKWVKGRDAEFIVQGRTKQDAQVIDFSQKALCIVKDKETSDKVFERYFHFFPDNKQPGVKLKPTATISSRRGQRAPKKPGNLDLLRIEFEQGCGSLRQCIRLASLLADAGKGDTAAYRDTALRVGALLSGIAEISGRVFPCQMLHYLQPDDERNWKDGALYGVLFANSIKANEQLFTLCKQIGDNQYFALFDLKLERDGKWTTPDFVGLNGLQYPSVSHANFGKAIMWLINFSSRDDNNLANSRLKMFIRDDPGFEHPTDEAEQTNLPVVR